MAPAISLNQIRSSAITNSLQHLAIRTEDPPKSLAFLGHTAVAVLVVISVVAVLLILGLVGWIVCGKGKQRLSTLFTPCLRGRKPATGPVASLPMQAQKKHQDAVFPTSGDKSRDSEESDDASSVKNEMRLPIIVEEPSGRKVPLKGPYH